MNSGVPSVLASTKMISIPTVGTTASRRASRSATFPTSFFVGTTIETSGRAGDSGVRAGLSFVLSDVRLIRSTDLSSSTDGAGLPPVASVESGLFRSRRNKG